MSNKSCPLCNRPIEDEGNFCMDCRDRADHESLSLAVEEKETVAESKELLDEDNSSELIENQPPKKAKSSKKLILFVVLGSLFCLIVGLGGNLYVRGLKQSEVAERNYWESCVEVNTPLEYSKYLLRFPEGTYRQEAEKRIGELRQQEYNEWLAVQKTFDIGKYTAYLAAYPESPHKAEIMSIGDSISWVEAERANTADAYDAYIKNAELGNINGDFKTLAQEKYDYLSQLKTVEGAELESIRLSLNEFFEELSTSGLKKIEDKFTPNVTRFFSLENISATNLKKAILAEIKTTKVEKFTYKPDFTDLSVIKDNKNIYFVEFALEKTIVHNKKKQETFPSQVKMELTFEKQVSLLEDKTPVVEAAEKVAKQ